MNTIQIQPEMGLHQALLVIEGKINEIVNKINNMEADLKLVVEASVILMTEKAQIDNAMAQLGLGNA